MRSFKKWLETVQSYSQQTRDFVPDDEDIHGFQSERDLEMQSLKQELMEKSEELESMKAAIQQLAARLKRWEPNLNVDNMMRDMQTNVRNQARQDYNQWIRMKYQGRH